VWVMMQDPSPQEAENHASQGPPQVNESELLPLPLDLSWSAGRPVDREESAGMATHNPVPVELEAQSADALRQLGRISDRQERAGSAQRHLALAGPEAGKRVFGKQVFGKRVFGKRVFGKRAASG